MKALNLTNQQFGQLTVICKSLQQTRGQSIYWDCECKCGNKRSITASQLRAGNALSCGCRQTVNLVGKIFGELTVLKRIAQQGKRTHYKCLCSCGNSYVVDGSKLPQRTSCGCKRTNKGSKPRLPIKQVVSNFLYSSYKRNATHKGVEFNISRSKFKEYIFSQCYYCGDNPKKLFKKWRANEKCYHNGIDRKNNDKGYIHDNCVPCCSECNYKKNSQHINDFVVWIHKVAKNLQQTD